MHDNKLLENIQVILVIRNGVNNLYDYCLFHCYFIHIDNKLISPMSLFNSTLFNVAFCVLHESCSEGELLL